MNCHNLSIASLIVIQTAKDWFSIENCFLNDWKISSFSFNCCIIIPVTWCWQNSFKNNVRSEPKTTLRAFDTGHTVMNESQLWSLIKLLLWQEILINRYKIEFQLCHHLDAPTHFNLNTDIISNQRRYGHSRQAHCFKN